MWMFRTSFRRAFGREATGAADVRGIIGAHELFVRTGRSDLGCGVLGRSLETNGFRHVSVGLTV